VQYDEHNGHRTLAKSIELSEIISVDQIRLDQGNVPKYADPHATISVTKSYFCPAAKRHLVTIYFKMT